MPPARSDESDRVERMLPWPPDGPSEVLDALRGNADRSCDQPPPPPPPPLPADLELFGERNPREPLDVEADEVGLVTGDMPIRPKPSRGDIGPEEVDEVECATF